MQLSFALALMILGAFLISENKNHADSSYNTAQLDAIASNMLIYSNAVATYAKANPGLATAVSDVSLALPSWYVRIVGVNNYISAGKAYIYYSGRPDLVDVLSEKTESVSAGTNQAGTLVSPKWGVTSIPIPGSVPSGAVVYVL